MLLTDMVSPRRNCRVQMQLQEVWNDIERLEHRVEENSMLFSEQSLLVDVLQHRLAYVEKQHQLTHKQRFDNLIEQGLHREHSRHLYIIAGLPAVVILVKMALILFFATKKMSESLKYLCLT